jgi:hypothetical protein
MKKSYCIDSCTRLVLALSACGGAPPARDAAPAAHESTHRRTRRARACWPAATRRVTANPGDDDIRNWAAAYATIDKLAEDAKPTRRPRLSRPSELACQTPLSPPRRFLTAWANASRRHRGAQPFSTSLLRRPLRLMKSLDRL